MIFGGAGEDTLDGGYGSDILDGGAGIDLFRQEFAWGVAVVDLGLGLVRHQTGFFPSPYDDIDSIANVENTSTLGAADHRILGSSDANHMTTGPGDDSLEGRGGADTLVSTAGHDILVGDARGLYHVEESAQVYRMYGVFGREPDSNGHHAWTVDLLGFRTLAQTAAAFVATPEFQSIYGGTTDAQFVTLLCQNMLNRLPSDDDRDYWVARLESDVSREGLVVLFSESAEHIRKTTVAQDLYEETRDITNWGDDVWRLY